MPRSAGTPALELAGLVDAPAHAWVPQAQLGGALFERAAGFAARYHNGWQWYRRGAVAVRDPQGALAVRDWTRALPGIEVPLPAGVAGEQIRVAYHRGSPIWFLRPGVGVSVLALPAELAAYRRGKKRQALRTNVTRALKEGITVAPVGRAERRLVAQELLARRGYRDTRGVNADWISHDWRLQFTTDTWLVARGPNGDVLALASVLVAGPVAWLALNVGAKGDELTGWARWLMHQAVVEHAIDAGATLLVSDATLPRESGLHHYQNLLGFRFARLNLTAAPAVSASASVEADLFGSRPASAEPAHLKSAQLESDQAESDQAESVRPGRRPATGNQRVA